ncbi:hypothetical protein Dimus_020694 [Dionaea muscipula]
MGFDIECIVDIQSLKGEYFCPVCRLLVFPNEALQTPCFHLYCKPCLTYVASTTRACPYDGYLVNEADCKPLLESNKAVADVIWKIPVHCLYNRSGCTWQGAFSECTSHCSGCAFGNSPVICNRCGVQIVHRQVQEHAQSCPGGQPQTQQPDGSQDAAATGTASASDQGQTGAPAAVSFAQVQTPQASMGPPAAQNLAQQAGSTTQTQTSQAALPTPEQMYQQHQHYQQYYQQYHGYDPYQQQYQQHYPYQQQALQQFQQQPMQGNPTQFPGHQPPLINGQTQPQPQVQLQQQVQAVAELQSQQPQASLVAQSQPHTQAQATGNPHQLVHPTGQPQPPFQGHGQALPNGLAQPQSQTFPQVQPYAQPQPYPPQAPQQHMQMPQYLQQGQMQYPHPQLQPKPFPHPQTQHYPHPQSQPPHSQPVTHPPSQPHQLQAQHPAGPAVTGYQSYPQPQQLQPQTQPQGPPSMHAIGPYQQPQQPSQMQGQISQLPMQLRPSQSHAVMPNQQLPGMLPSQVPPSGGPVAQQPSLHPHARQAGYPVQQRPGMLPAQQAQQPTFPGQDPFISQQPTMQAQSRAQGVAQAHVQAQLHSMQNFPLSQGSQSNVPQNFMGAPMISQGVGAQPFTQASVVANAGLIVPSQLDQPSATQNHGANVNNQLTSAMEQQSAQVQQPLEEIVEKPDDKILGHSKQGQDDRKNDVKGSTSVVGNHPFEMTNMNTQNTMQSMGQISLDRQNIKSSLGDSAASELLDMKKMLGKNSELHAVDNDLAAEERNVKVNKVGTEVKSEPWSVQSAKTSSQEDKDADKQAEVSLSSEGHKAVQGAPPGSTHALHQPHHSCKSSSSNSVPSTDNGRNQLQPIQYSHQQKPGGASSLQSTLQSGLLLGNPPAQLRSQGPGQVMPSRQPFVGPDGAQPTFLKQPPGAVHLDGSVGTLGSGTASSVPRGPANMGPPPYNQGALYQAGQPKNPMGDPFGGPSFPAQPLGSLDSHGGIMGRGPAMQVPRGGFSQQRPNITDFEMFPVPRPHFFNRRQPNLDLGQPSAMLPNGTKFSSGPGNDSLSVFGMQDERFKPLPGGNLRPFPPETAHNPVSSRDMGEDLKKFPRPSKSDAGLSSEFGSHFPSMGDDPQACLAFGSDRIPHPFEKMPYDHDSGGVSRFLPPPHLGSSSHHTDAAAGHPRAPGFRDVNVLRPDFNHSHPNFPEQLPGFSGQYMDHLSRSPGRDYAVPPHGLGGFRGGDLEGNEQRSFGKPLHVTSDPLVNENKYPLPPTNLWRGELDGGRYMRMKDHHGHPLSYPRPGDLFGQEMMHSHLRIGERFGPRNSHLGEGTGFGGFTNHGRPGKSPFAGKYPPHLPFGESLGADRSGHPLLGDPGFRSSFSMRHTHDGGFLRGEMDPFDNPKKRKSRSVMCRICKVDCQNVEGLDVHSQSREHQEKAIAMVLSIKQQNSKKQKTSNSNSLHEEGGKPRDAGFEGRGNEC